MSGDLVSLRMLLVAVAPPELELWRQAAVMASIPIEFEACDAVTAASAFLRGGVDICVLAGALPDDDRTVVIRSARAATPSPLVIVSAPPGSASTDGIDGLLRKPETIDDAHACARICVRAKLPTRVLVVDDSRTMRGIVCKILSASRFSLDVQEASGGADALDRLRAGMFDLVLLDYNMPDRNGFQILLDIKRVNQRVAVVMMTSDIDKDVASRTQAAGAYAFLKKPFYPADIDAMLRRYLGLDMLRP